MTAALQQRGLEHEKRYVDGLRARGLSVVELAAFGGEQAVAATIDAMKTGVQAIVQASLQRGPWNGRADVLLRVERESALGAWSYEPVDTKLARETRAASILQLALYAELASDHLGALPERFCVVTPGEEPGSYREQWERVDDFHAYFRFVRDALASSTAQPTKALLDDTYPEPVEHCDVCRWWESCDKRRRADDHLSLVAGITRLQRRELTERGVHTLAQLAEAPLPTKLKRGSIESFERVRKQARMQWLTRAQRQPLFELLPIDPMQGLCTLPLPSAGDVFLDIEGNPFAESGGREYLFGVVTVLADSNTSYQGFWATTVAEERKAFEALMDLLRERWVQHPGMHVYHYAPYEPSALKRLMNRHATREDGLDKLLRGGRFVDLYRVVKNALIAGVERYSIKDLEVFYGFVRQVELRTASRMLRTVEQALELSAFDALEPEVINAVEGYNREDCESALHLRNWLEQLRSKHESTSGSLPRPDLKDGEASDELAAATSEVQALATQLLADVPESKEERTPDQHARWLLAHMLEFHRREDKSTAWEYFRMCALADEEYLDERGAIAGLTLVARVGGTKKAPVDRYAYPEQDCDVRRGKKLKWAGGADFGKVEALDRASRTVDIKKTGKTAEEHPTSVFVDDRVSSRPIPDALLRLARWVVEHGVDAPGEHRAARDLLLRRPPRLRTVAFRRAIDETTLALATRVAPNLDCTVLPIQGPPGAGKTYTAKHMICELVRAGKKVGITAVGHEVIHKLLAGVVEEGKKQGLPVRALAKTDKESALFATTDNNAKVVEAVFEGEANVVGGTAWLWSREDCHNLVDVLFVDEAGQMSLANVLAVAQAATSIVLVGDPQQLEQPLKGSHPDGVDASALQHLLGEHKTVPDDAGIFLDETWRLAPAICDFTSELFYERRLKPRAGLERHQLQGTRGFDGAGLWYAEVSHAGCQSSSLEEVERITAIVDSLLVPGASWTDKSGSSHQLRGTDLLIVAPYNAQVSLLSERLHASGVRIGTVDKFQGQEAPVVIYGMTTSSPQDAPRGMDFLYSANRLNVATSRAQCACILVASRSLFEPECKKASHVRLANAFCRYLELARRAP